jgi:hypothetical protein
MNPRFVQLALLAGVVVLAGCAAPARIEQMQAEPSAASRGALANSPMRDNIALKDVTGGKETNPMWVSNVGSPEFERALEGSLRASGLLSTNRQAGKYVLTAHLLKLDQPMFGASMTVTASVQYLLAERATGKEVFSRTITLPYTAAFSDAFIGTERLKLANEGAIRTNIAALIEALGGLKVAAISLGASGIGG